MPGITHWQTDENFDPDSNLKIWFNGELVPAAEARVSVFDHGLLYGDNIFIVREGQLQTPPTSAGLLEGITRNTIIRLARQAGIEVVEKNLVRMDLYGADECFLTGTGAQVIPVTEIDKRPVGTGVVGPVTKQLSAEYNSFVRRRPV